MSINTDSLTSATTKFAETQQATFVSSKGGSIEMVSVTPSKNLTAGQISQITDYASSLIASMGSAPAVATQAALGGIVAASASAAALGSIDPTALFAGAAAGLVGSISKGKGGRTA